MRRSAAPMAWLAMGILLAGCVGTEEVTLVGETQEPAAPDPVAQERTPVCFDCGSVDVPWPRMACRAPCLRPVEDGSARSWEPSVAVSPLDPDHIVVGTAVFETDATTGFRTSWLVSHVTRDGGEAWESVRLPGGFSAGPEHPLFTANALGDPVLAFLADGTLAYVGLAFNHVGHGTSAAPGVFARTPFTLFVARSHDGGLTFPDVAIVRAGEGAMVGGALPVLGAGAAQVLFSAHDKPWILVDREGSLRVFWSEILVLHPTREPTARIDLLVSRSDDGGATWSEPDVVIGGGGGWFGAAPAQTADGALHVAAVDMLTLEMRLATSLDAGETWTNRTVGHATHPPSLAADGARLVLAYGGVVEEGGATYEQDRKPQRAMYAVSDDGGATWERHELEPAAEAPGRSMPQAAAVPGGGFVLAWHQHDGEGATLRAVALRNDERTGTLTLDAPRAPATRLGDYMGITGAPEGAVLAWVTSPDGEAFDVMLARLAWD